MPFRRSALSLASTVSMLWLSAPAAMAFAQQWVGDLYMTPVTPDEPGPPEPDHASWLPAWALMDEDGSVRDVIPSVRSAMGGFPEAYRGHRGSNFDSHWLGDALYALVGWDWEEDGDGAAFRRWAFAKWRDGEWRFLAGLRAGGGASFGFVPCDGDRFILVSSHVDMFDNGRQDRSPFCRVSVGEGKDELRIDASIDHGQDDLRKHMTRRACQEFDNAQTDLISQYKPNCFDMAKSSDTIVTDGRATLVNGRTGLYWVFSTETARLVKAGSIFRSVTPEMVAGGGFDQAVLHVWPEKSGTVLVAAQDEYLLTAERADPYREASELYAGLPQTGADDAGEIRNALVERGIWETIARVQEEMEIRSPHVVWYRIHPDDGRVERLLAPPEGGSSTREVHGKACWIPMPDGSLKALDYDGLKKQVSSWAGGRRGAPSEKEPDGAEFRPAGGDLAEGGECEDDESEEAADRLLAAAGRRRH
jgi:hypothetical protein